MLPKIESVIYSCKLPITNKIIKFRPFVIRDSKAMMLAQESEDMIVFLNTVAGVVDGCTFGVVDVLNLPMFEFEYLFMQIRSKSVGETQEISIPCTHENCNCKHNTIVNLSTVEIKTQKEHTNKILLADGIGVVFKYPTVQLTIDHMNDIGASEDALLVSFIDYIYDKDSVYPAIESTRFELSEFLNQLTDSQFEKISTFVDTMPILAQDITFTCAECCTEQTTTIKGLSGFFS
jgi:hypothetical protein